MEPGKRWPKPLSPTRILIAVALLTGIGFGVYFWPSGGTDPSACEMLNEVTVGNLQSFDTLDGGSDGGQWYNVLTDGITSATSRPERVAVAQAIRSSYGSFLRLRDALPESVQPVVDRLRSVTLTEGYLDGVDSRSSSIARDISQFKAYGGSTCGLYG